jgi:hypothetical protein
MRESATLARSYGVSLHTHLAEIQDDVTYSLKRFLLPSHYPKYRKDLHPPSHYSCKSPEPIVQSVTTEREDIHP